MAQASLTEARKPGAPLAELVRVGNGKDLRASFTLGTSRALRVYGLGEAEGDEWADFGWIEDAQGKRVWEMRLKESHPAGGDSKNRMVDEAITLPKGAYTLRYRSDDSHAYGHWNERPPRDKEHYGLTVWAW